MKTTLVLVGMAYIIGFAGTFWMHTQMPVTFGLAIVRSAAWPISLARRELWPRGAPLPMD